MKDYVLLRKSLGRISSIIAFLFVLIVFLFSLYKILTITKIINPFVYGAFCNSCDCSWCEVDCSWCRPSQAPPEATPTEPVEPSPTPVTPPPPSDGGDGGGGGGNGGPGEPWSCGAFKPPAPTLLSVTPSTSVDLSWTAVEPVTHYQISYGLSSGDYIYGIDNTGNVTSYNVGGLDPGVDYCFAVRGINDCMPSDLSNEICTGEVGRGQVLGATTLAETGSFDENLLYLLFIMGSVCSGIGLRLCFSYPAKLALGKRRGTVKKLA